jgi:hypothetical protein
VVVVKNPRNGRPYRELCKQQKALGPPRWIYGHNIAYEITGCNAGQQPFAFTLDHYTPLSKGETSSTPPMPAQPSGAATAHAATG